MSFDLLSAPALSAAWTGAGLCASLIVAIGAQNAFVLRQGLRREHVLPIVVTCIVLDVTLMAAGVAGLGSLVTASPTWLALMTWGGVAALAWYGFAAARRAWRPGAMSVEAGPLGDAGARRAIGHTLALSLLNPHVWLDTVVLVGAIGARQAPELRAAFVAGAGLSSALWFAGLGFGARLLAPWFARPRAWRVLDAAVALTMWTLAVMLARG